MAEVVLSYRGRQIREPDVGFLRELIRQEKERRWKAEHSEFVSAFNAEIENVGLPLDQWRTF